jgi:hypothetical protein
VAAGLRRTRHSLLGPGDRKCREAAGELLCTALGAGEFLLVASTEDKFLEFVVADIAKELTNWHN